jgi:signal transduction histidine kinase
LTAVEVVAAVVFTVLAGWSVRDAFDAFVVTNSLMGFAFGTCGAVIAWHRPANPIGWLFIADGIGHATTAAGAPLLQLLHDSSAPTGLQRGVLTVSEWAWPWSIGLFLPLALLLFPDGHLLSPRWRPVAWAIVLTSPLFALEMGTGGEAPFEDGPTGYLKLPSYDALQPLWTATELRGLLALLLAIMCLVIRYRRATETGRRQLLWLLLAAVIALSLMIPWSLIAGTPVFVLLAIPLVPVAVAVAIVRHQLLDIRLVVSRAIAWGLLSLVAIGSYVALVAVTDSFVSSRFGRSAALTVVVALLIAPVLPRLQRLVDRAMYGDRRDPARVASRIGAELSANPSGGLESVAAAIREALRFPYVALETPTTTIRSGVDPRPGPGVGSGIDPRPASGIGSGIVPRSATGVGSGPTVASGSRSAVAPGSRPVPGTARTVALNLSYGGTSVGSLLIGLRPGESELTVADRNVLTLVAVPLAVAVHATRLSAELQTSREQLVSAREEERRRLRRDLHDGLGPALTGVAFTADAAANLVTADPARASELLRSLRTDTRTAIADVRRLVDDLRPPALDEIGLVGALRQRADQLSWRADGASIRVRVEADELPALPAALEVAAYRIATEALTNVVRHSHATIAVLTLRCGSGLELEVQDDGPPQGPWIPGVGLQAMCDRATELGGRVEAGPTPTGGRVTAWLPLNLDRETRGSDARSFAAGRADAVERAGADGVERAGHADAVDHSGRANAVDRAGRARADEVVRAGRADRVERADADAVERADAVDRAGRADADGVVRAGHADEVDHAEHTGAVDRAGRADADDVVHAGHADEVVRAGRADGVERADADGVERTRHADKVELAGRAGAVDHAGRADAVARAGRADADDVVHAGRADGVERTGRAHAAERTGRADGVERAGGAGRPGPDYFHRPLGGPR